MVIEVDHHNEFVLLASFAVHSNRCFSFYCCLVRIRNTEDLQLSNDYLNVGFTVTYSCNVAIFRKLGKKKNEAAHVNNIEFVQDH